MPGELDKAPINPSHDFQLGVLFARVDEIEKATEKRNLFVDGQFKLVREEIKSVSGQVALSINGVVDKFQHALDEQTAKLTPLLDKEAFAQALKTMQKDHLLQAVNKWQIWAAVAAVVLGIVSGLGTADYLVKTYVHGALPNYATGPASTPDAVALHAGDSGS